MDIRRILASNIRKNAENFVEKEMIGFENFDSELTCMCALCSCSLRVLFERAGFEAKIIIGWFRGIDGHCWVESGEKIYCVTSTQFKGIKRKIFILNKSTELSKELFRKGIMVKKFRDFNGWPTEQKPYKIKMKRLTACIHKATKQCNICLQCDERDL